MNVVCVRLPGDRLGSPIQGVPRLSPLDSWDRLQHTSATQKIWISRYRKWMDDYSRHMLYHLALFSIVFNVVETFKIEKKMVCKHQDIEKLHKSNIVHSSTKG